MGRLFVFLAQNPETGSWTRVNIKTENVTDKLSKKTELPPCPAFLTRHLQTPHDTTFSTRFGSATNSFFPSPPFGGNLSHVNRPLLHTEAASNLPHSLCLPPGTTHHVHLDCTARRSTFASRTQQLVVRRNMRTSRAQALYLVCDGILKAYQNAVQLRLKDERYTFFAFSQERSYGVRAVLQLYIDDLDGVKSHVKFQTTARIENTLETFVLHELLLTTAKMFEKCGYIEQLAVGELLRDELDRINNGKRDQQEAADDNSSECDSPHTPPDSPHTPPEVGDREEGDDPDQFEENDANASKTEPRKRKISIPEVENLLDEFTDDDADDDTDDHLPLTQWTKKRKLNEPDAQSSMVESDSN